MNKKNELGKRIKTYRQQQNLTGKELSKLLNITPSTLSNWENGIYKPDVDSLYKIAEIFNISILNLLGETNTNNQRLSLKELFKNEDMSHLFKELNYLTEEELSDISTIIALIISRRSRNKK